MGKLAYIDLSTVEVTILNKLYDLLLSLLQFIDLLASTNVHPTSCFIQFSLATRGKG